MNDDITTNSQVCQHCGRIVTETVLFWSKDGLLCNDCHIEENFIVVDENKDELKQVPLWKKLWHRS